MTFLSLVCVSEAKKKFVCFSADFWVAQVDGLTDEWMSDFFVVRKRIRNDERLISSVETFSFALKKGRLCVTL